MTDHDIKKNHAALRVALQRGIPLVPSPLAALGAELDLSEDDVLRALSDLFAAGTARRFGAVFDSRHLGYGSTLCAVDVPAQDLERVAGLFMPIPGVTHCYEREGQPNLWFTMTAPADRLQAELRALGEALAPYALLDLPALKRFKVEVVLDAGKGHDPHAGRAREPESGGALPPPVLSERERDVVRMLQGNLLVSVDPFAAVADTLGWDHGELLTLLQDWKQQGILRRVGVILRHRKAGFTANGMCIWSVPDEDVDRAGRALACNPEVTHCYERPPWEGFPYNLFAMVHARERKITHAIYERLTKEAGLNEGKVLISVREFKKTSPVFFRESAAAGAGVETDA